MPILLFVMIILFGEIDMIRLVDEGFLDTRIGRLIDQKYNEICPICEFIARIKVQACFNDDIE